MFKVTITNIDDAELLIKGGTFDKVISLIDPIRQGKWLDGSKDHLIEYFDDVEMSLHENHPYIFCSPEQMQRILDFAKTFTTTDNVLLHCHGGVSRSPSVMIAILCQLGMEPRMAMKATEGIRPAMFPNKHMLQLADDILKLDGELVYVLEQWRTEAIDRKGFYIDPDDEARWAKEQMDHLLKKDDSAQ